MKTHYVISVFNLNSGTQEDYKPKLDGKPRIFLRKKDAVDFAYDYEIAGKWMHFVEYRKEPLTAEQLASGTIYKAQ